jgi:hypothetical protein
MSDADDKDFAIRAPYIQKVLELESELEALKRERAMLVERLKPFAQFECGCGKCHNCLANQALSATEPQATQWLKLHDAEVIRNYMLSKEAGHTHCCVRCGIDYTPPEGYEDCPKCGCDSNTAHELRLAASKRKEQKEEVSK